MAEIIPVPGQILGADVEGQADALADGASEGAVAGVRVTGGPSGPGGPP